jgi:hypothetical protein
VAAGQEPEAVLQCVEPAEGIGGAAFEPADRAGGPPGEDDAVIPGAAQDPVQPVDAPDGKHVRGIAAADVDRVLVEQKPLQVEHGAVEESEMAGVGATGEGAVEQHDRPLGIAAGGRQVADSRPRATAGRAGERENVLVQRRLEPVVTEPAATHGHDRRICHRRGDATLSTPSFAHGETSCDDQDRLRRNARAVPAE